MSKFVSSTMEDIRCGRENWRVIAALGTTAFIISIATTMLRVGF